MAADRLRPGRLRFHASFLLAALLLPVAGSAAEDPWSPLRPLLGRWQGVGDGLGGPATVEHSYEMVLQDRLLHMRTRSVSEPAAGESSGELQEDGGLSSTSLAVAKRAVSEYGERALATLADLVRFRSVHVEGTENATNPEFRAMTEYLSGKAAELGLDFSDHGAVLLIGLGEASDRVGIVAHADVQPADPSKWARDPFALDTESEPGRLVGRGTEDDKGPLATALYAMKAIADLEMPLERRIELIVSYTEESDWDPFRQFLAGYDPPEINFALDATYPVVTGEKGWGEIHVSLPVQGAAQPPGALISLSGGSFLSQVPEDAEAVIAAPGEDLEGILRDAIEGEHPVAYSIERDEELLRVRAHGVSAHSMDPWEGRNAITHLARLLARFDWPDTPAARLLAWIDDLVGIGDFAEAFGDLAYEHPFMGRLTLTLATVVAEDGRLTANLSLRRPVGRSAEEVENSIRAAVDDWRERTKTEELELTTRVFDPYLLEDAPHVATLLEVFRHYTGIEDAAPVAIGGGTNARLLPNGVSFGPSMPGQTYTGHSEHEFISRDQFLLNLEMYTAALAELSLR